MRIKLLVIAALLLINHLSAQFSSTVDYVEQQKKIDENRRCGASSNLVNSSFDWEMNGMKNVSNLLKGDLLNCKISVTTTNFGLGAYYGERNKSFDLLLTASVSNLNRSASITISGDSVNTGFTISEFTLWQYRLDGGLQLNDQPYFINTAAEISAYNDDDDKSGAYFITLEPGAQFYKTQNSQLLISAGTTIFDDSYAGIYGRFLYLTKIPDQYFGKIRYNWHRGEHSTSLAYKFALLPEDLFETRDYSNLEAGYQYQMPQYHFAAGLTAGLNFEHNANHLTDPQTTIPQIYYILHLESEYLKNRLQVGFDWELSSVKTALTDDSGALKKTSEALQNSKFEYKTVRTGNDRYNLKLSIGYKL